MKRAYLVKVSGSMGSIYDFSNVYVWNDEQLKTACKKFGAKSIHIKYAYYDERIHFHKWHVMDVNEHHLVWLLTPTDKKPTLSEWHVMDEGM